MIWSVVNNLLNDDMQGLVFALLVVIPVFLIFIVIKLLFARSKKKYEKLDSYIDKVLKEIKSSDFAYSNDIKTSGDYFKLFAELMPLIGISSVADLKKLLACSEFIEAETYEEVLLHSAINRLPKDKESFLNQLKTKFFDIADLNKKVFTPFKNNLGWVQLDEINKFLEYHNLVIKFKPDNKNENGTLFIKKLDNEKILHSIEIEKDCNNHLNKILKLLRAELIKSKYSFVSAVNPYSKDYTSYYLIKMNDYEILKDKHGSNVDIFLKLKS
ncbi:MAG: hypothetical protein AB1782_00370 [Cyanobacteriota bacterium]